MGDERRGGREEGGVFAFCLWWEKVVTEREERWWNHGRNNGIQNFFASVR